MKRDYRVAIPSLRRPERLATATLALLRRLGVPDEIVDVFLSDPSEEDHYREHAPKGWRGNWIPGKLGMAANRNACFRHYDEGQKLVCIDDDVQELSVKVNDKRMIPLDSLDTLVNNGFELCQQMKCRLWGIYPVYNALFMKERVRTDLTYIVGCFFGVIVKDVKTVLNIDVVTREDALRTIKCYLADGAVVRIESVAPKTRYWTEPGGIQSHGDRVKQAEAGVCQLLERYPLLCTRDTHKRFPDIRLKDRR